VGLRNSVGRDLFIHAGLCFPIEPSCRSSICREPTGPLPILGESATFDLRPTDLVFARARETSFRLRHGAGGNDQAHHEQGHLKTKVPGCQVGRQSAIYVNTDP
jgi:hypothetical protein